MSKQIAVIGVGAVGSYIGGQISRAGHDITLIDMWPAHVDRMNEHGLHITGPQGEFTVPVKAVHLTDAQQIRDPFDIIILSVKSYDTEWAAHFAKRFLAPNGIDLRSEEGRQCLNRRVAGQPAPARTDALKLMPLGDRGGWFTFARTRRARRLAAFA